MDQLQLALAQLAWVEVTPLRSVLYVLRYQQVPSLLDQLLQAILLVLQLVYQLLVLLAALCKCIYAGFINKGLIELYF